MELLRSMWKQARGGTVLYRGMHLSVSLDKMVRDGAKAAIDSVLRAAQEPARYGDTGIGVHWTESLETAKDFAWQIGYDNYMVVQYPYEGRRGAFSFTLPLVLVAKPAMGSIRTDDKVRDQYRMTDVGQTDPDYGTSVFESEIPVAHGGEIRLESIIVAMPSAEIIQRYVAMPDEKRPTYDKVISKNLTSHWSWVEVRAPLKIKASREVVAWGEDHAFTITTNTDMTAQKFVRWLAPDFNSAWVQPDGTVTACYTHAHVGDVATILDRGWVRMDVMPNVGKVFVQSVRPLTDDQIQSVRICVIQSEATVIETSTGLGDAVNLHEYPVTGPSAVTKVLSALAVS